MSDDERLSYDPAPLLAWYDEGYAEREWSRFDEPWGGPAGLEVHRRFVAAAVDEGDLVLDIGSGPGRFAIQAVELGARVVVADLSPAMLRANEQRVGAAGAEHAVVERVQADVTDLFRFEDGRFDVTLCLGGPLSYAADRAPRAVAELVRVTVPGGTVVVSVMSTLGAYRKFLPGVIDEMRERGPEHVDRVLATGELHAETNRGHPAKMYRWDELRTLLESVGCEVLAASAANVFTEPRTDLPDDLSGEERRRLLDWEVQVASSPGALDLGTHIVAAARTPT